MRLLLPIIAAYETRSDTVRFMIPALNKMLENDPPLPGSAEGEVKNYDPMAKVTFTCTLTCS